MADSRNDDQERAANEVRLLILCAGDPEGERTFSGSARSLFHALERRGVVHAKGNVTRGFTDVFSRAPLHVRIARRLDKFGLIGRYRWSRFSYRANTKRAEAFARRHRGYNACLMYGTNYNPQLGVPTYCYFDATSPQVFRGAAWEFARLGEAKANDVIQYQREVFANCTAVFPRSEWAASSCREDYGLPESKICVAGAGANHEVTPLPHGPYDGQTILFIGREWERKGGGLILEAFRRTRRALPGAKLIVIGCDPPVDEPGVERVGVIHKDNGGGLNRLLEYYSRASLFCIMSTFEPFGIVVVEAQNSYLPCVVPARFAFTETVIDGVTGRHVKEDDPDQLAAAFIELLSDPSRLAQMGEAAHAHVQENYRWDVTARRIHERIAADIKAQRLSES
jgi:glycosyltransferase involved in cell wall biosynthesis